MNLVILDFHTESDTKTTYNQKNYFIPAQGPTQKAIFSLMRISRGIGLVAVCVKASRGFLFTRVSIRVRLFLSGVRVLLIYFPFISRKIVGNTARGPIFRRNSIEEVYGYP